MSAKKSRPADNGPAKSADATTASSSPSSLAERTDSAAAPRREVDGLKALPGGLTRSTLARDSAGHCNGCSLRFDQLGAAVSHARASGHTVEATYAARYLYVQAAP